MIQFFLERKPYLGSIYQWSNTQTGGSWDRHSLEKHNVHLGKGEIPFIYVVFHNKCNRRGVCVRNKRIVVLPRRTHYTDVFPRCGSHRCIIDIKLLLGLYRQHCGCDQNVWWHLQRSSSIIERNIWNRPRTSQQRSCFLTFQDGTAGIFTTVALQLLSLKLWWVEMTSHVTVLSVLIGVKDQGLL